MKLKRIAILLRHPQVAPWNFSPENAQHLRSLLPETEAQICSKEDEFVTALHGSDACMVWTIKQSWLNEAPLLRLISTPAAGRDYFRITPPINVHMMNGHFHGTPIAETVTGMLLSMTRGILPAVTTLSGNAWARQEMTPLCRPLHGSHVVILGFGHIGQAIGRVLKPFGVRISGMKRNLNCPLPAYFDGKDRIFAEDELDSILPTADHLILSLPGTEDTTDIISGRRLGLLQSHTTIINVGRGNAIDEMSLYSVLKAGRIAGAFLDVFEQEPLPQDSPLLNCPRLWHLPHASAITPDYLDLYIDDFYQQLQQLPDLPKKAQNTQELPLTNPPTSEEENPLPLVKL